MALALSGIARAGFSGLEGAQRNLELLSSRLQLVETSVLEVFQPVANPDSALDALTQLTDSSQHPETASRIDARSLPQLALLLGASEALLPILQRNPSLLDQFTEVPKTLSDRETMTRALCSAVQADASTQQPFAGITGSEAVTALRVAYRRELIQIALFDLAAEVPAERYSAVALALSNLATAALEAALAVARSNVRDGQALGRSFDEREIGDTRLAVIALGKCGAEELNYVSDVDVVFVAEPAAEAEISDEQATAVATSLATELMRVIHEPGTEPALWQVDPNLRPEGKQGALVRSLASHIAYYERWAKDWEYQALLKARFAAGDAQLGESYVQDTRTFVWNSASQASFVESARQMRERVESHIDAAQRERHLKLGAGGLRDVEFTVQLLQLVHGRKDESLRTRNTLNAITALTAGGYIARADAEELSSSYETLRVIEHRLQLQYLRRTAVLPEDPEAQRVIARASRIGTSAEDLLGTWQRVKTRVRELHLKIFYAPLLSAVADIHSNDFVLSGEEAADRLSAIGFLDPKSALRHISALTQGVSRRATIQRNLLPVILQWLSEGIDPDYGLLVFRRISDNLGTSPWYLRLLRDGSGAASRLSQVLSNSKFIAELMEQIPESVAWLEEDDDLQPRSQTELAEELAALLKRHRPVSSGITHVHQVRRRELLRLALANTLGVLDQVTMAVALSALYRAVLSTVLAALRAEQDEWAPEAFEFAVIELGRLGGDELTLASDLDLMFVYRQSANQSAEAAASALATELKRLLTSTQPPLEIDLNLRPEGRAGSIVRSLESYRAYYQRWSLTWEAQALLRARADIGDARLCADFQALADDIRYPDSLSAEELQSIRLLKARVETERLPNAADPSRHLKLGPGALSDVEWLVQLLQLQHAHAHEQLRQTSTLKVLHACAQLGYLTEGETELLQQVWMLAANIRTANLLVTNRSSDVLPRDARELEALARTLGYPAASGTQLEQDYLAATRQARRIFDERFYGYEPEPEPSIVLG